jgi:hypothetical protein
LVCLAPCADHVEIDTFRSLYRQAPLGGPTRTDRTVPGKTFTTCSIGADGANLPIQSNGSGALVASIQ